MATRLGIIAGSGALPRQIVAACGTSGRRVFVLALAGECDPETTEGVEHAWVDAVAVGKVVATLRDAGCNELVLAGRVGRPDFRRLTPVDRFGLRLLPKLIMAATRGDDAIFRTLVEFLEGQGFRVVGPDALLDRGVAPAGPLGNREPRASDRGDIEKGRALLRALGPFDVGQAAVVRDGHVVAIEAAEGTDAMLTRCAGWRQGDRSGVLVKLAKPEQQRRVDLPTIGPRTVQGASAAGLAGIAVEAGATLLVDRARLVADADTAGLFVVGIDA